MGRAGDPDHVVLKRCLDDDRVLVTHNPIDFRKLVGRVEVHPGLIILEENSREASWSQPQTAIQLIAASGGNNPRSRMLNRVIEVDAGSSATSYLLPQM